MIHPISKHTTIAGTKEVTCPRCVEGKKQNGFTCWNCMGKGKVKVLKEQND